MARLMNVGFGNVVNTDRILAIVSPDSAPAKRLISKAKENETIIDATQGRRTKSVVITDTGQIVLSALLTDTLVGRFQGQNIVSEDM